MMFVVSLSGTCNENSARYRFVHPASRFYFFWTLQIIRWLLSQIRRRKLQQMHIQQHMQQHMQSGVGMGMVPFATPTSGWDEGYRYAQ